MRKSDRERLKKVVHLWVALKTQISVHKITKESLLDDEFLQWAVTTPLYNIGEQVYGLSTELKNQYPEIPWSVVSGLRHRLVHDYQGINWSIIVEVIFDEMDGFVQSVADIADEE